MRMRKRSVAASSEDRVYSNSGNAALVDLLTDEPRAILDVGCGAGDNALLIQRRHPDAKIYGITRSPSEAALAGLHMTACWVADLEQTLPPEVSERTYDAIIFSHVLEHLRDPAEVVSRASEMLRPGGACIIAVPNVLAWAQRAEFLMGRFEYETAGTMDETHIRFFTYQTAPVYLLAKSPALKVESVSVTGAMPLWILRRHVFPAAISAGLDQLACRIWPNLFGSEVLIKAVKEERS